MITEKRDSKNQMILSVEDLREAQPSWCLKKRQKKSEKKPFCFCLTKLFA